MTWILGIIGFIFATIVWGSIVGAVLITVGAVAILEGGGTIWAWLCLVVGLAIAFALD